VVLYDEALDADRQMLERVMEQYVSNKQEGRRGERSGHLEPEEHLELMEGIVLLLVMSDSGRPK
jgi:hypothetical protein